MQAELRLAVRLFDVRFAHAARGLQAFLQARDALILLIGYLGQ